MNEVIWNESALKELKEFPEDIKKSLGYLIFKLQIGEMLNSPHSKPMPSIGRGCYELRVRDKDGTYRAFYYLKVRGRILILHAFKKKTKKTPKRDINIGKNNLKEMLNEN